MMMMMMMMMKFHCFGESVPSHKNHWAVDGIFRSDFESQEQIFLVFVEFPELMQHKNADILVLYPLGDSQGTFVGMKFCNLRTSTYFNYIFLVPFWQR